MKAVKDTFSADRAARSKAATAIGSGCGTSTSPPTTPHRRPTQGRVEDPGGRGQGEALCGCKDEYVQGGVTTLENAGVGPDNVIGLGA